jgi:hypothetical protein
MCSTRDAWSSARSRAGWPGSWTPRRWQLRQVVDAEEAAPTRRATVRAAIACPASSTVALARLCGNPVFVRMVDGLLPATSLLMALYQPAGQPACVAHRHVDLLDALRGTPPQAAAEMRRHLQEIERSLAGPGDGTRLRDVFAAYRDGGPDVQPERPAGS